jgi:predicted DNA-binding transcriptional regulator AlpA
MSNLLKFSEVYRRLGWSRGTGEARIKDGILPKPARQGQNRVWPEDEINAVAALIAAGKSDDELRHWARRFEQGREARAARALAAALGEPAEKRAPRQ